eukprot:12798399-Ditylum_brightwellii.AAC.1
MELRAGHHRPFILPCVQPIGKVMRAAMVTSADRVELGASHYRLFILPCVQPMEKTKLSTSSSSGARGVNNDGGRSGSRPFKMSYDTSSSSVISKKYSSRPFKECTKKEITISFVAMGKCHHFILLNIQVPIQIK